MTKTQLTRFAPSPTGYLHLGHARAAFEAFDFGACLLRIEDIDHTRCRPEYTHAIYEDLSWLGLNWPEPVRIQSEHKDAYESVIRTLYERELIYPCFRTRREIEAAEGPAPLPHQEAVIRLARGDPHAWRLHLTHCREQIGDVTFEETGPLFAGIHKIDWTTLTDEVIARRDIGLSYHLCVTHDDALQNITHVVRGIDLFETTPYHRILQELMGWPEPVYYHHDILRNTDGNKLSKRNQDTTIRSLREQGLRPKDVLDMAFGRRAR